MKVPLKGKLPPDFCHQLQPHPNATKDWGGQLIVRPKLKSDLLYFINNLGSAEGNHQYPKLHQLHFVV